MKPKRLVLGTEKERKLLGVCSGLANYLEVDPTIVRLAFVASVLVFGFGFLPYLIGFVVIPNK